MRARNSHITIDIRKATLMKNTKVPLNDPAFVFTNYDIGLSAALLCAGFELLAVEKSNPRKALFMFRRKANIEDAANGYFTDKLKVKARSFFDHLKALKNQLYS